MICIIRSRSSSSQLPVARRAFAECQTATVTESGKWQQKASILLLPPVSMQWFLCQLPAGVRAYWPIAALLCVWCLLAWLAWPAMPHKLQTHWIWVTRMLWGGGGVAGRRASCNLISTLFRAKCWCRLFVLRPCHHIPHSCTVEQSLKSNSSIPWMCRNLFFPVAQCISSLCKLMPILNAMCRVA